jgi:hypothetical protein
MSAREIANLLIFLISVCLVSAVMIPVTLWIMKSLGQLLGL